MAVRWPIASGNFSNLAIWNDSASLGFPTASDVIYSNNFNINIDQSFEVIGLRNLALARDIATPAMTSNNTPSPFVAAASSIFNAGFDAFQAFNRNYATNTYWATAGTVLTGWLSIDFGSSIIIDGYTIYGSDGQTRNPRNWTLEGSNNNSTWTVLHTVSGAAAIPASGTYSISSIGNTTGYRYYRVNITLNGGSTANVAITELELYERFTAALAAGGSFIFNSGSISGSATSTTAALIAGATNLIQVTAATGSVTLSLGSAVTAPAISSANLINHSGNCNFNLNGTTFNAANNLSVVSTNCIGKSSTGTITIVGDLIGSTGGNQGFLPVLNSTNGNTVVIGNVRGGTISNTGCNGISQTAGNITVTGNVIAGNGGLGISLTGASSQFTIIGNVTGGTGTSAHGINHSGTSGSVIGNVTGGSGASSHGINTVGALTVTGTVTGGAGSNANGINASGVVNVTGNILGNVGSAVATTNNITAVGNITGGTTGTGIGVTGTPTLTATVTGTLTAGSGFGAINFPSNGQTVNLTGNMINVAGKQAINSQNLFISDTATTQWRLFTPGGQDKTLYSADTFPNQPTAANVRSGSLFGPSNVLSGSMVVPSPSDVRVNVLTDNTVGTGQSLTAADFLAAISASADPYAERLRNVATVDTVGSLLTGFNNGGF
jgi:hypothetical protein